MRYLFILLATTMLSSSCTVHEALRQYQIKELNNELDKRIKHLLNAQAEAAPKCAELGSLLNQPSYLYAFPDEKYFNCRLVGTEELPRRWVPQGNLESEIALIKKLRATTKEFCK